MLINQHICSRGQESVGCRSVKYNTDSLYIFDYTGINSILKFYSFHLFYISLLSQVNAYLKQKLGYRNVKRLRHGIIGYERWLKTQSESGAQRLSECPPNDQSMSVTDAKANNTTALQSAFVGKNFLFDRRRLMMDEFQQIDVDEGKAAKS